MYRLLPLLGIAALALVMVHAQKENQQGKKDDMKGPYKPMAGGEYTTAKKKCYQCGFTYPKTVIKELKVPRNVTERVKVRTSHGFTFKTVTKVVYDIRHVTETTEGGWEKCMGPFTHEEADYFGIDAWDCEGNCYTRLDMNGDLFRGCYSGAYGVDQRLLGCYEQGQSTWCFCEGEKCNTIYPPERYETMNEEDNS